MEREPLLGDEAAREAFRSRLLEWYRENRRMPKWRDTRDPYRVWLSEVMLQQTRVEQMGPYFERFVNRFPSVDQLAAADETEVLKMWEGLGYYTRARNLHRAARQIVAENGGRIPDTREGLLALPGVGPYTSAAVASIAFDRDHPVLDGNVTRVLCRLLLVESNPRRSTVRTRLLKAAECLLAPGQAGDFNQAMMELGAGICTPRSPACATCPVAVHCRALSCTGDPSRLPFRGPRPARPHYQVAAGVIWRGDRLLIAQRPQGGMLEGLWEFPGGKQEPGESLQECLVREIREELDFQIAVEDHLVSIDHAYSHFSITLHAFRCRYVSGRPHAVGCADWRWVGLAELSGFPFPRTDTRIIEHLLAATLPDASREQE